MRAIQFRSMSSQTGANTFEDNTFSSFTAVTPRDPKQIW